MIEPLWHIIIIIIRSIIMLIKIYQIDVFTIGDSDIKSFNESLHIIDDAEDVVVHQGNYALPIGTHEPALNFRGWGPTPQYWEDEDIHLYGHPAHTNGGTLRIVDYTKNGIRKRALISKLAYICNNQGKTIEKVEMYSGAKLSVV